MTIAATYDGTCCSCGNSIMVGQPLALVSGIGWLHQGCASTWPSGHDAKFIERLRYLLSLRPKRAREVAMTLGVRVTKPENRHYYDRNYVAYHAAKAGVFEDQWHAATKAQGSATASSGGAQQAQAATSATGSLSTSSEAEIVKLVKATVEREISFQTDKAVQVDIANAFKAAKDELVEAAKIAAREVAGSVVTHQVRINDGEARKVEGRPHKQFGKLLKMVAAGVNVWLAGPAGSGKTTAAEQCAKALGLDFYFNGAIDTEYKLSGFVDAHGRVVSTAFRRAFEQGGLYLFDEVDASLPGATLAFNAALANGACDFPGADRPSPKHPSFRCVAAGNTWGFGATSEYVGRNKLDAAFLDRFVQLTWDYDEDLEAALVPADHSKWVVRIQKLRAAARKRGLKVVISPRASIHGSRLLAAGMSEDEALDATVRAKISPQDWTNLSAEVW